MTKSLIEELEHAPESVQREVLAFLRYLRARGAGSDGSEDVHALLPLAESAWAVDWDTPEEDEAWRNVEAAIPPPRRRARRRPAHGQTRGRRTGEPGPPGRTGPLAKVHAAGANGVVELTPVKFLDRLADLVPPPRKHRHRYPAGFRRGLFASRKTLAVASGMTRPITMRAFARSSRRPASTVRQSVGSHFHHFGRRMGEWNRQAIFGKAVEMKLNSLVNQPGHLFA